MFWHLLDSSDDYDEAVITLLHLLDTLVAVMTLMKLPIQVLYQKGGKKKLRKHYIRLRDYQILIVNLIIFDNFSFQTYFNI